MVASVAILVFFVTLRFDFSVLCNNRFIIKYIVVIKNNNMIIGKGYINIFPAFYLAKQKHVSKILL